MQFYALLVKHTPIDSLTPDGGGSLRVLSLSQLCNRLSVCQQRHQLLAFRPSIVALALLNSTLRSRGFDSASALRLMLRITELDASDVRRCQNLIDSLFDFAKRQSSAVTASSSSPGKSSKRKVCVYSHFITHPLTFSLSLSLSFLPLYLSTLHIFYTQILTCG